MPSLDRKLRRQAHCEAIISPQMMEKKGKFQNRQNAPQEHYRGCGVRHLGHREENRNWGKVKT
jgi:hypothetical protein